MPRHPEARSAESFRLTAAEWRKQTRRNTPMGPHCCASLFFSPSHHRSDPVPLTSHNQSAQALPHLSELGQISSEFHETWSNPRFDPISTKPSSAKFRQNEAKIMSTLAKFGRAQSNLDQHWPTPGQH